MRKGLWGLVAALGLGLAAAGCDQITVADGLGAASGVASQTQGDTPWNRFTRNGVGVAGAVVAGNMHERDVADRMASNITQQGPTINVQVPQSYQPQVQQAAPLEEKIFVFDAETGRERTTLPGRRYGPAFLEFLEICVAYGWCPQKGYLVIHNREYPEHPQSYTLTFARDEKDKDRVKVLDGEKWLVSFSESHVREKYKKLEQK